MISLSEEARLSALQFRTRRHFLQTCATGLGAMAMGTLGGCFGDAKNRQMGHFPHFTAKAKRVIYLHMAGSPSQLELFEYKPALDKMHNQLCPDSFLQGKRFAFISGKPKMLGHQATFNQYGESGAWVSERMPFLAQEADKICFLKAMYTDQINHAPAQLLLHTGSPRLGRPSMGSWATYGLGTENEDLPGFVVLVSGGKTPDAGKSVWGSGFLPSVFQGVQCRSEGDPVLYVSDPPGMSRELREKSIATINRINQQQYEEVGDPEILSRIAQYELAFRMQLSVPEAMDIKKEPDYIQQMYGVEPGKATFANNCLLARRLAEKGVRFIQLFHWGWDSHGASASEALNVGFMERCKEVDQPIAALLTDLKQRGLLDETLVVWGGEFGRTPMMENRGGIENPYVGRDHHIDAFTIWMAGGGIKEGYTHGQTDEFGYNGISGQTHVHDLQATILHCLGFDHEKLTFPFQGRDFRLTDVHGKVIQEVLS